MTETSIFLSLLAEEEKAAPSTIQVTPASDSEPSKDKQKADVPQGGEVFK